MTAALSLAYGMRSSNRLKLAALALANHSRRRTIPPADF